MEQLSWNASMGVSALILMATFAGIFTEGVHHIHRTKIAMLGAAVMVVTGQLFGFYGHRVATGAYAPAAPTDPDVRDYRIRLLD